MATEPTKHRLLPVLQLLSISKIKAFIACMRMHHYGYELGMRPVRDTGPRAFGTCGHHGARAYWFARQAGLDEEARVAAATGAALRAASARGLDAYARAKLWAMVYGYCARWDVVEVFEVVSVEAKFEMPLVNPATGAASRTFLLSGRMDAVVRLMEGLAVVEHKFTSEDASAGSVYRERLALDGQVSQYFFGCEARHGALPELCVYDVVRKPALRPYQKTANPKYTKPTKKDPVPHLYKSHRLHDETPGEYRARCLAAVRDDPERYYQRVEVVRLEADLEDYRFSAWQYAGMIREAARAGRAPKNTDACFRYGQACDYWPVCTGRVAIDDPRHFARTVASPELEDTHGDDLDLGDAFDATWSEVVATAPAELPALGAGGDAGDEDHEQEEQSA